MWERPFGSKGLLCASHSGVGGHSEIQPHVFAFAVELNHLLPESPGPDLASSVIPQRQEPQLLSKMTMGISPFLSWYSRPEGRVHALDDKVPASWVEDLRLRSVSVLNLRPAIPILQLRPELGVDSLFLPRELKFASLLLASCFCAIRWKHGLRDPEPRNTWRAWDVAGGRELWPSRAPCSPVSCVGLTSFLHCPLSTPKAPDPAAAWEPHLFWIHRSWQFKKGSNTSTLIIHHLAA